MLLCTHQVLTIPTLTTTEKTIEILPIQPQNKTIEQIMTDQTEAVRKIIEAQRQTDIDYPIVTKKETAIAEKTKDEIKIQCAELTKQKQKILTTTTTTERVEIKPLGPFVKPDLMVNRRRFNGLVNDNVKLIKFEPVILQKTILKDGQVVYYWHKSLPFPQYLVVNPEEQQQKTTPTTTTTTTTSTTTTTEKPNTTFYGNQLRFVVPMNYHPSAENNYKNAGNYDPFAYFSKYVHPQHGVPIEVSAPPTLPVIKTLLIPNRYYGGGNVEKVENIN